MFYEVILNIFVFEFIGILNEDEFNVVIKCFGVDFSYVSYENGYFFEIVLFVILEWLNKFVMIDVYLVKGYNIILKMLFIFGVMIIVDMVIGIFFDFELEVKLIKGVFDMMNKFVCILFVLLGYLLIEEYGLVE